MAKDVGEGAQHQVERKVQGGTITNLPSQDDVSRAARDLLHDRRTLDLEGRRSR